MIEIAHMLTSPTKIRIFNLLGDPVSPDKIASTLNITRQGVDKHLKDFLRYGIAEKMWILTSNRPRIEYQATSMGRFFYDELSSFLQDYRKRGEKEIQENLRSLDLKFINGELDKEHYLEMKNAIQSDMSWFIDLSTSERL